MADEIDYPFIPCSGAAFQRADTEELMNIQDLVIQFNDVHQQQDAVSALGIDFKDESIKIVFREHGNAYYDHENDRTRTQEYSSDVEFSLEIKLDQEITWPLPMVIEVGGWIQENVNFLGKIVVFGRFFIPLTGRGTAALEGKPNDCHAGYCTGGACASFQERAALILATALAAGASNQDLQSLADEFAAVDARYHGRREILDYTLHCCLYPSDEAGSYREFMINRGGVSPVMLPLLTEPNGIPGPEYFTKVRAKLSEAELQARAVTENPAVEEYIYPVLPRAPTIQGVSNLSQLAEMLSYAPRQMEALRLLGFNATGGGSKIELTFRESGCAYHQPHVDRQLVEQDASEMEFQLTMELKTDVGNLPIAVEVGGWMQDQVNFLGMAQVKDNEQSYVLPLTGRGTAALEGRRRDAHAGFCTGGACAGFQVRSALCLAVARAIGASDNNIRTLGENLHAINARYHGRDDILDYTIHCALTPNASSYLVYMTTQHGSDNARYPLLQAMKNRGRPNRGYFEALLKKYSTDELDEEKRRKAPVYGSPNIYAVDADTVQASQETDKEKKIKRRVVLFTKVAIAVCLIILIIIIIIFFTLF